MTEDTFYIVQVDFGAADMESWEDMEKYFTLADARKSNLLKDKSRVSRIVRRTIIDEVVKQ